MTALYGLLDHYWLVDQEDFLNRLNEETKIVYQVMAAGLTQLKISVVGSEETERYLNGVIQEIELLK